MPAAEAHSTEALSATEMASTVEDALASVPFVDVHTHLYRPSLGRLGLWGIDELLTYHYLEAELFRSSSITPENYFSLTKEQQADLIWQALFIEHTPISEAARGVVHVLHAFGLPTDATDLKDARAFFAAQDVSRHIDRVFAMSGMSEAVMTNDPLDPVESVLWKSDSEPDRRFHPALRLDRILEGWRENWAAIERQGYQVDAELSPGALAEVRRFLADWIKQMKPVYLAVSLADSFTFPEEGGGSRTALLEHAVLPSCREFKIPLSLMIGVRRQVNPRLRLAGDASGHADLRSLERLCRNYPDNRFLVSVLSRENQHELCVYARKFSNLLPFGCWWFLNNPSIVEEVTRERIEMLGFTFIPQHSDARILEQVIYKWHNTRRTLAPILANSYRLLLEDGRTITADQVKRDIERLFRTNVETFCGVGAGRA